jgi:RNase H-fold protein (predicted Holliday junction resolvase)
VTLIEQHMRLVRELNRLPFEVWSEAVSTATAASKQARESQPDFARKSEDSFAATCRIYRAALVEAGVDDPTEETT